MIGTKRFRWYPCALALGILLAAGAARADFILAATEHLEVTTSHSTGILYDSSTAGIRQGGSVQTLYVNDGSTVDMSGGLVSILVAYDSSAVDVSGGSVSNGVDASSSASVSISGGSVHTVYAYDTSTVKLSGGWLGGLDLHGSSAADVSGGSMGEFYARDNSTIDISGGSVSSGIYATNTGKITFHGYDFRTTEGLILEGDRVLGTGILTGKWFGGSSWIVHVYANHAGATILAVPEPATLALLALGGLAMLRRRRR